MVELGWENFVDNLKIVGRIVRVIGKVGLMIGRIIGIMEVACIVRSWLVIVMLAP